MKATIHAVDQAHPKSDGNFLHVRGGPLEIKLRRNDGLPLGEHKDQYYLELQAVSLKRTTESKVTVCLNADELQRLLEEAVKADLVTLPVGRD